MEQENYEKVIDNINERIDNLYIKDTKSLLTFKNNILELYTKFFYIIKKFKYYIIIFILLLLSLFYIKTKKNEDTIKYNIDNTDNNYYSVNNMSFWLFIICIILFILILLL